MIRLRRVIPACFPFASPYDIVPAEVARVAPDESAFSPVRAASLFPRRSVTEKGRTGSFQSEPAR